MHRVPLVPLLLGLLYASRMDHGAVSCSACYNSAAVRSFYMRYSTSTSYYSVDTHHQENLTSNVQRLAPQSKICC